MERADQLIQTYMPYIRSETSKFLGRMSTEHDDETSIAMIAFHEAIQKYSRVRGAFFRYAALLIRSRLIDYQRMEAKHRGHLSMEAPLNDGDTVLGETIPVENTQLEENVLREATRDEIMELSHVMQEFGLQMTDVADHSPKQERTLAACREIVQFAVRNPVILEELKRTKKLPLAAIVKNTGVNRKTIERHRKYILALLLLQTNGYDILRGHIRRVLTQEGGADA